MTDHYQKSKQHLYNMRAASIIAKTQTPCPHCQKQFTMGNIAQHMPKCLHDPKNARYCINCSGQLFERDKKFCNRSCAAKYNNQFHSPESRKQQAEKVSQTLKGRPSPLKGTGIEKPKSEKSEKSVKRRRKSTKIVDPKTETIGEWRNCVECKLPFIYAKHKKRTTCSETCKSSLLSRRSGLNAHKWGKCLSIPYYCKQSDEMIKLQSRWEVEIAEYLDDQNIKWTRPKSIKWWSKSLQKERHYYPDFHLVDFGVYLDPKNPRVILRDQEKLEAVMVLIPLIYGSISHLKNEITKLVEGAGSAPAVS